MSMAKIIITVPKESKDPFKIDQHGNPKAMSSAYIILKRLERLLTRRIIGQKTTIIVKYDNDLFNETIPSNKVNYILYATTCFLEDYLTADYIIQAEKEYEEYIMREGENL